MTMEKVGNYHARIIATALLVVAGPVSSAIADTQPTYDKRIEEAAIRMLVPKLGDMRGSLDPKSNEFLRPIVNEQIIERPQAVIDTQPVESPKASEDRRVVQDRQIVIDREGPRNPSADKALQVTQAPQMIEDKATGQEAPSKAPRSKGSFLFF